MSAATQKMLRSLGELAKLKRLNGLVSKPKLGHVRKVRIRQSIIVILFRLLRE